MALSELRELARGLHPALLTERGLGPASRRSCSARPCRSRSSKRRPSAWRPDRGGGDYLIAEALTNVAKHAHAQAAEVRVARTDATLVVQVRDDGVGGADAATGTGLEGLADRVEALGGHLELTSRLGAGTTLSAEIPV